MIRFHWDPLSVKSKVASVQHDSDQRKLRKAFDFLVRSTDSAHGQFVNMHADFLKRYPHATERQRRRRLQFIETVGLENVLWTTLFWRVDQCLTYGRSQDERRLGRHQIPTLEESLYPHMDRFQQQEFDDADDPYADDTIERHSIRARFASLVRSPLLGCDGNFELPQFAYYFLRWSDIGAKKNLRNKAPIRVMMKGHSFSPLYWPSVKSAVQDFTRQLGPPLFFRLSVHMSGHFLTASR